MTKIELQHLTNQDTDKNLVQDLLEFSDAEKKELETIKKATIDTKLEHLNDAIINGMEKEKINAELGAKLLLGQTIDAPTRQLSSKTDDQLIATAIKYIYYTLGADKDRDSSLSKTHGLRGDSSLAQALQHYLNTQSAQQIPVDGKLGNITKKAIKLFLHITERKNPTNTEEKEAIYIVDKSLGAEITKLNQYTKQYGNYLASKNKSISDGALCTLYTKNVLAEMSHYRGKKLDIRDLSAAGVPGEIGGAWNILARSQKPNISKYISSETLPKDNSVLSKLGSLKAGSTITLQYSNSDYKSKGVTHTIISHGEGQFSHRFGKQQVVFNMSDIQYDQGDIIIKGSRFHIHTDSRIYTLLRDKLPSFNPRMISNPYPIKAIKYAQEIADQHNIPKEYVITQMLKGGYILGKVYQTHELSINICIAPEKSYQRNHEFVIEDKAFDKRFGKYESEVTKHQRAVIKSIFHNEQSFGENWLLPTREGIKETYKDGSWLKRKQIELLKRTKTGDSSIDSFGPFQINKHLLINAINNNKKRVQNIENDLLESAHISGQTLSSYRSQLSSDKKVRQAEQRLCQDNIAFKIVNHLVSQSGKELSTHIIDGKSYIVNEDDLALTSLFDYNKGRSKTAIAIFQQNIFILAKQLQIDTHLILNESKYYIDGEIGPASIKLLEVVMQKLGLAYGREERNKTLRFQDHDFKINTLSGIQKLFEYINGHYPNLHYHYINRISLQKLKSYQDKQELHLHYGYTLLNNAIAGPECNQTANERAEHKKRHSDKVDVSVNRSAAEAIGRLAGNVVEEKYKNKVIHLSNSKKPYFPMPPNINKNGGYLVYQGQCADNKLKPGDKQYGERNNTSLINTLMSESNFAYAILTNGIIVAVGEPSNYTAGAGYKAMLNGDPLLNYRGNGIEVAGSLNPNTSDLYPPTPAQLESMKFVREHLCKSYKIPINHITTSRQVSEGDGHSDTKTWPDSPEICQALGRNKGELSQSHRLPDTDNEYIGYNGLIDQRIAISRSYLAKARNEKEKEQIQKSIQYRSLKKSQQSLAF